MWVVILFSLLNLHFLCATPTPYSQQYKLQSNVAAYSVCNPKDHAGRYDKPVLIKGNLTTSQNHTDRLNGFVTVNIPVHHYIVLNDNDKEFLKNNASKVTIRWFIDCQLVASTTEYYLNQTYNDTTRVIHVAAFLLADLDPTTTTIMTPTTTPKSAITTENPTTTTGMPTTIAERQTTTAERQTKTPPKSTTTAVDNDNNKELTNDKHIKTRRKREAKSNIMCSCLGPEETPENYAYGQFYTDVHVSEPINSVNITGPNHLQEGDTLNLKVKYKGSGPFVYCIMFKPGLYNITGNETCEIGIATKSNSFLVKHEFSDYGEHTVVVVIENKISKNVSAATINVHKNLINGKLIISQNNTVRSNGFVAVNESVHYYINLDENDKEFLKNNASKVITYWFADCELIGSTDDFSLNWNYTHTMGKHKVEAVLIANLNPEGITAESKLSHCDNSLPFGDLYTFRRYETVVKVREPITSIDITGQSNWLQHGDLLNLKVKYTGSPPFHYCVIFKRGQYNVVGNETCTEKHTTVAYSFPLKHYFLDGDQHTVVVVIENDIVKKVSGKFINIFKASVQPQLSVIVVPVVCCLIAVIFVVLGIAYYQHRSRHTVEVADFDFGQNHAEFKTLRQRIRDSLANIFHIRNQDDTEALMPSEDD